MLCQNIKEIKETDLDKKENRTCWSNKKKSKERITRVVVLVYQDFLILLLYLMSKPDTTSSPLDVKQNLDSEILFLGFQEQQANGFVDAMVACLKRTIILDLLLQHINL